LTSVEEKYSLLSRVEDRKHLKIDDLEHYSLLLQLGKGSFQVCITDKRKNSCLLLEDYLIHGNHSVESVVGSLKQLFDDHHFLLANFWGSVTFSIKNEKFTLVPHDFFSENHTKDYLKFCAELAPGEEYFHTEIKEIGAVSVFAVDKQILDFLSIIYVKVDCKIVHHSSCLIKALLHNKTQSPYKQIYMNLDEKYLQLTVMGNGKMFYYNQFKIKNPSDLVRYTILVAKEFDLDLKQHRVLVWSSMKDDALYAKELSKYIRHVQHGQGPSFLKRSHDFDEIPEHQYLDVYGIYL
jgi:hypothetical protein